MAIDSLTWSLGALGAAVVAGLALHGAWQARRAGLKRAARDAEAPEPREPVLDEPAFGATGSAVDGGAAGAADAIFTGDELDGPAGSLVIDRLSSPATERRRSARQAVKLDALIDAIAPLAVEAPVRGDTAIAHLPATRRAGAKPFLIEGLEVEHGVWEAPTSGRRYREFQAGVQLANRNGPLNEIEYSEFVQKVQAFADAIGAMADFPDMLDATERARELDDFASRHDAQLALRLYTRSIAWSVAYVQQRAGRHAFRPGVVPGRLVMPDEEEGAPPLLALTFDAQAALADDPNLAAVRELTLHFDVPQTAREQNPYAAWRTAAEALAADLDAVIVDDRGQPLSAAGFDAIGAELGQLYDALAERDLPAGSGAARRLFS